MSELNRPASVRELLDCLPRSTLVHLCDLRGLELSRANDDCRSRIARSFRGQRDELLNVLRKDELVTLLQMPIRDGDDIFVLDTPEGFAKRELLELAITAFGRTREIGRPFVRASARAPKSSRASAAADGLARAVVDASEHSTDTPGDEGADLLGVPPAGPSSGWSRPRRLAALFGPLGLSVPAELTQGPFSVLVETLENRGYEIATMSGERLTPLHDPPKLDDEVRVRHDALATPAATAGVGTLTAEATSSRSLAELGDYPRASLRLELLMAGIGGDASEKLVGECIETAAAGLPLEPSQRNTLAAVARRIVRQRREPFSVLTDLAHRIDAEDGEVMLREYCSIHRPGDEMRTLLFDHWSSLTRHAPSTREGATERPAAPLAHEESAP